MAVQDENKKFEKEIHQLKATVVKLRKEAESLTAQHTEDKQKLTSSNASEVNHFRNLVRSLREQIDQNSLRYNEKIQQNAQLKEMEFSQLRETIIELRSELEKYNGN